MDLAEKVIADIDAAYAAEPERKARGYIGASSVGEKCDAALAFSLRGFPDTTPDPKLKRIFRDGHRIERDVVRDLKKAGFLVIEVDDLTGRQHRHEMAGGHVVCHTDGLIDIGDGELMILEIKSMNNKLWNEYKNKGVRLSHPKYWDQMQMMMGMSGCQKCLFIAYNKDNSLYHVQIVDYDDFEWSYIKSRIQTVWSGEAAKISDDPSSWLCRFCFKRPSCWDGVLPDLACRTCQYASPQTDGGWWCGRHSKTAVEPCEDWSVYRPKDKK